MNVDDSKNHPQTGSHFCKSRTEEEEEAGHDAETLLEIQCFVYIVHNLVTNDESLAAPLSCRTFHGRLLLTEFIFKL